ncbi:MAG: hypothetical protein VXZ38_06315, partial [Planctomycetota bacterium]|nr:hypothetical protein [Planctomycetota bacterium]
RCGNVFLPVPDSTMTAQGLASQCLVLDCSLVSRAVVGIGLAGEQRIDCLRETGIQRVLHVAGSYLFGMQIAV